MLEKVLPSSLTLKIWVLLINISLAFWDTKSRNVVDGSSKALFGKATALMLVDNGFSNIYIDGAKQSILLKNI